jgi:protein SCO1
MNAIRQLLRSVVRPIALAACGLCLSLAGHAHDGPHDMSGMQDMHDLHHHHAAPQYHVKLADYAVPDIKLVRDDGRPVSLRNELDDGRPVLLNFVYTTCPGICPMMSQSFSQFQQEGHFDRNNKIHMVSISIDPEQDTPPKLREYAKKFGAGPQWQHYTGTVAASVAAQQAFDAYNGDKMAHDPLTLMRLAPGQPWVRIEGFATGPDLLGEFAKLSRMTH